MAEVQLCVYCNEPVDMFKDYVVVRKEYQGNPETVAHVGCRQKAMREIGGGPELVRG